MPKAYGPEAIETCRGIYCRRGGRNHDLIEADMRKAGYPGWRKTNLINRNDGKRGERIGWIEDYGFENSLRLYTEKLVENVNDDEQGLYLDIKTVRKRLAKAALGSAATKDDLSKFRDYCKLEIEARRNLDLSRDNLDTFVAGYEKVVMWLGDIDPAAAKLLIRNGEKLVELAHAHYGKPEEIDDGAGDPEDEGGERPQPSEAPE